jgi:hypothetical protein
VKKFFKFAPICWESKLLLMLNQLLSKSPSSYCIRTIAKFAIAIPYHVAFSIHQSNPKKELITLVSWWDKEI